MCNTQNHPLEPDEKNPNTLLISASPHFVIWGQEWDKQLEGEKRNWSRNCSIMRFSNSNKNNSKTFPSLFNIKCLLVHDLMLFLKLNTVCSSLAHCSDHYKQPFVIFKLGEHKKAGGIFDFSVYRWYGDVGTWGSWYVLSGAGFCLTFHIGLTCLQSTSTNGRFGEGQHFFRKIL